MSVGFIWRFLASDIFVVAWMKSYMFIDLADHRCTNTTRHVVI